MTPDVTQMVWLTTIGSVALWLLVTIVTCVIFYYLVKGAVVNAIRKTDIERRNYERQAQRVGVR